MKFTAAEVETIARVQKQMLRVLLASGIVISPLFVSFPPAIAGSIAAAVPITLLLLGIVGATLTYRLAKALQDPIPWLYVICSFIPTVNVIILLILNMRATAALRANGVHVGLLGAADAPPLPENEYNRTHFYR